MDYVEFWAFSSTGTKKAYQIYFNDKFEFIPKSESLFLETLNEGKNFGEGIKSRCFRVPKWLYFRLKGRLFYDAVDVGNVYD